MKTITGTFTNPDGTPVANGKLILKLNREATLVGTAQIAPTRLSFNLGANGAFTASVVGNDELSPSGTAYELSVRTASDVLVYGPVTVSITGASPYDLNAATLTSGGVFYKNAVLINETDAQTMSGALSVPSGITGNVTGNVTGNLTGDVVSSGASTFKNSNSVRFADQYAGADLGAKVNAAVADLPAAPVGGTVVLPAAVTSFSTQITFDRPVTLVGHSSGYNNRGTVLAWNGGASAAIALTNSAASGSRLCNFSLNNIGTGTVGIDIDNNIIGVTLDHVFVTGSAFSVAGIRVGNTTGGFPVTNIYLNNVEVGNQVTGLLALRGNHIVAQSSKFFQSTTNDVQIGSDSNHQVTSAKFIGCDIENGSNINYTNVKVLNAQDVAFIGCYAENDWDGTTGGPFYWLDIPSSAVVADSIKVTGTRFAASHTPPYIVNTNFASASLSIVGCYANGYPVSSFWVRNQSSRRVWLSDLGGDANISFASANTNVSFTPGNTSTTQIGSYYSEPIIVAKATGTAPFTISSTTPVSNLTCVPVTYDATGTQQTNTKIVRGSTTLAAGTATVTLTGSAVFTGAASYTVVSVDSTAAAAVKIATTSGSQFTITGTGTDVINWIAIGN